MVFCFLKEIKSESAIYYFGSLPTKMDGEIEFFTDRRPPEIIIEPTEHVSLLWIGKLWSTHRDEFFQGTLREKISYEC